MVCVCHLPLSGARSPRPCRAGPKRAISGTFSPMNALWRRQFDIDENETNCVNYKYCLVDAPGVFKFLHRLGESAADQLRGHLEQGISDGHTQPCRAADLGWQLRPAVAKPCLGMHKLDNICSSSVYGLCVSFAPERGLKPHAPAELVPKRAIFGYFFANERPWRRQFDIDENETNCVN